MRLVYALASLPETDDQGDRGIEGGGSSQVEESVCLTRTGKAQGLRMSPLLSQALSARAGSDFCVGARSRLQVQAGLSLSLKRLLQTLRHWS